MRLAVFVLALLCLCRASFYDLVAKDIKGNDVAMSTYEGKVVVIVNVASQCGYTEEGYKEMSRLADTYRRFGVEILAFPCNQFGSQEPGTESEIEAFASKYSSGLNLFSKVDVNGDKMHPVFAFLKEQFPGEWLLDRDGTPLHRYEKPDWIRIERGIRMKLWQ